MISWSEPTFESQPALAGSLLQRAVAGAPGNPQLLYKLGNVHLDRYDFAAAAESFSAVLNIEPGNFSARLRLARCYNELARPADCLDLLAPQRNAAADRHDADLHYHRAAALSAIGRKDEAETEVRAALAVDAHHRRACTLLIKLLRKSDRTAAVQALCETLAAKGVRHAQLLLEWGRVCTENADPVHAAGLQLDHGRIFRAQLPPPMPFGCAADFNAAFADDLLSHPAILRDLPSDEANQGSRRIHQLLGGRRPELVRALAATLQDAVSGLIAGWPPAPGAFDPWREAIPSRARLNCWALIQQRTEFEAWHFHRGGWMSGVYYVRMPEDFSIAGAGAGCLEFGPSGVSLQAGPGLLRIAPREGLLVLAPSHYLHRTIPFSADGYRVSFAFDVVPDDNPTIS